MGARPPEPEEPAPRDSSFRLEIAISIGYQRRRSVLGGAIEGHVVTLALLAAGIAATLFVLWRLFILIGVL